MLPRQTAFAFEQVARARRDPAFWEFFRGRMAFFRKMMT
jgi:hypothetical protein